MTTAQFIAADEELPSWVDSNQSTFVIAQNIEEVNEAIETAEACAEGTRVAYQQPRQGEEGYLFLFFEDDACHAKFNKAIFG